MERSGGPTSSPLSLSITIVVVLLALSEVIRVRAAPTKAQFIFGDSLVDQGNNNNLQTLAKANFMPHGVDLAMSNHQPTGRFSNGRIISDFLSEYLNIPPVPAYNDQNAHGANLLRGCNFASAGSGILEDTGTIFIQRLTMNQQLSFFPKVKSELVAQLGSAGADDLIANALFSVTTGGNDYVNNYLIPGSPRAAQYNIPDYTTLLLSTFQNQIRAIYNLGARKISVSGIGPMGCIPDQLSMRSIQGDCVDSINQMAVGFNSQVRPMLTSLNQQLPGVTIVFSDAYNMVLDFVNNGPKFGFSVVNSACCGTGRFNGNIPCIGINGVCPDRNTYLFWDPFHPTDKANSIITQRLLFGPPSDIGPINLSQLFAL